ncbi:MAG: hypothetical protein ACYC2K_05730 [Gemmatimonadales bacterium]
MVVSRGSIAIDGEPLRLWLKSRLAAYKVPRVIAFADELPRNAMGKVTKAAIPAYFS